MGTAIIYQWLISKPFEIVPLDPQDRLQLIESFGVCVIGFNRIPWVGDLSGLGPS